MERNIGEARLMPGVRVGGKYVIERELGVGGVGTVALARHLELEHKVAIKYLRSATDPLMVQRFRQEAKIAASLHSEHVVHVYDVGVLPDETPFIVMEYLEGEDFSALMTREGPLPIHRAVALTMEACEALVEAHARGIVHRDIKPANLFLARRAVAAPIVKVLDFGISKRWIDTGSLADRMTRQEDTFGTPHYMPPEQFVSTARADARSDIWAMGVVLYELLTRRLPFEHADLRQLIGSVLSSQSRHVRTHRPEIPNELAQIIHACISYEPSARPASAADLIERLRPFASPQTQQVVHTGAAIAASLCTLPYLSWDRSSSNLGECSTRPRASLLESMGTTSWQASSSRLVGAVSAIILLVFGVSAAFAFGAPGLTSSIAGARAGAGARTDMALVAPPQTLTQVEKLVLVEADEAAPARTPASAPPLTVLKPFKPGSPRAAAPTHRGSSGAAGALPVAPAARPASAILNTARPVEPEPPLLAAEPPSPQPAIRPAPTSAPDVTASTATAHPAAAVAPAPTDKPSASAMPVEPPPARPSDGATTPNAEPTPPDAPAAPPANFN